MCGVEGPVVVEVLHQVLHALGIVGGVLRLELRRQGGVARPRNRHCTDRETGAWWVERGRGGVTTANVVVRMSLLLWGIGRGVIPANIFLWSYVYVDCYEG